MDKTEEKDSEEIILPINNTLIIAVSINKPELSSEISDVFGKSKYFLIYNSTHNTSEFLLNPFTSELGGAGIQSAWFLIEKNIEAVITKRIGINPLRFFSSSKIKLYQFNNGTAEEAIKAFIDNRLQEISVDEIELNPVRNRKRYGRKFSNKIITNNHNKGQDSI
ncbi:MAG: NifB/NifX family molybdenum-iron cluster-binding protein [Ignavibacteriales bacterium]|nr:NifB/NifX family molybdenum-iron cluster-binding protein [Ignavibacteriales bacterium]